MRLLPLVLLLAVVACDSEGTDPLPAEGGVVVDGVSLEVDRDLYDNDDTVALTLENGGAATVETGVLECAILERRTDGGWTRDLDLEDRACILIGFRIAPGDGLEGAVDLGDIGGAPDGTYRFVQGTSVGDVVSPSFRVR